MNLRERGMRWTVGKRGKMGRVVEMQLVAEETMVAVQGQVKASDPAPAVEQDATHHLALYLNS